METAVTILHAIIMVGLFILGFMMWVAWELITGNKFLSMMLAIGVFAGSWLVAKYIGATAPWQIFIVEALVAAILFHVANSAKRE